MDRKYPSACEGLINRAWTHHSGTRSQKTSRFIVCIDHHVLVRQSEELCSRITFNVQHLHRKEERNSKFNGSSVACPEVRTA